MDDRGPEPNAPWSASTLTQALGDQFILMRFDRALRLVAVNDAVVDLLGYPVEALLCDHRRAFLVDAPAAQAAFEQLAAGNAVPPFALTGRTRDGRLRQFEVHAAADAEGASLVAHDVTEAVQSQALHDARRQALEMLVAGRPTNEILDALCTAIEQTSVDMMCSVLLLIDGTMQHGAGPSLPAHYVEATDGVKPGYGVGACGTAIATGRRVICEDLLTHPYWTAFSDLVRTTPMRACWSEPLRATSGRVLGTFAMYYRQARSPSAAELAVIQSAAHICALVLDQRAAHEALAEAEARARLLLESTTEGLVGVDPEGLITFLNRSASNLVGCTPETLLGVHIHQLLGKPGAPAFCPTLDTARSGVPHAVNDAELVRVDGEVRPIDYRTTPIVEGQRTTGAVVSLHDARERQQAEAEMRRMAFHDDLTGLANRAQLEQRLGELQQTLIRQPNAGVGYALHLLDLDHFKQVNDTLGHPTGDALLVAVADRLRGATRAVDLVARLGGDEFAVLQRNVRGPRDAARMVERLLHALDAPVDLDHASVRAHASIGVTLAFTPTAPATVLAHADVALYQAKAAGRGTFAFYEREMTARLKREQRLCEELPDALASDALELVYQPIFDLADHSIVAYEAYLRWQHPELGALTPGDFLGAAEARGLGRRVDNWVIDRACRQLVAWTEAGDEVPRLHVNLTDAGVTDATWLSNISALAARHAVPLDRLGIDVTEQALAQASEPALDALAELTKAGLYLTLDDFATGFTRLGPLLRLGARAIEIDRCFVADLGDAQAQAIARAMVAMAGALELHVVAEGVEDAQTLAELKRLGCDQARGYLLGRPQADLVRACAA